MSVMGLGRHTPQDSSLYVKARFRSIFGGPGEVMWAHVRAWLPGFFVGTLSNDPVATRMPVQFGSWVFVLTSHVVDWSILRESELYVVPGLDESEVRA